MTYLYTVVPLCPTSPWVGHPSTPAYQTEQNLHQFLKQKCELHVQLDWACLLQARCYLELFLTTQLYQVGTDEGLVYS